MNRRSFLQFFGIGLASLAPVVKMLDSFKPKKTVNPAIHHKDMGSQGNTMGRAWYDDFPRVTITENVPAHRFLSLAGEGKLRGSLPGEKVIAISCLAGKSGEQIPARIVFEP